MSKSTVCAVLTILLALAGNVFANPFGIDITIPDLVNKPESWYGNYEDNEVEPGCVKAQIWDLEGFYLMGNILSIVGGFDFKNGAKDPNSQKIITTGDVFIDTNITGPDAAKFGPSNDGTGYNNAIVTNRFGYDYALSLNFTTSTYLVYQLGPATQTKTAFYQINQEANPVSYVSGGNQKSSGAFTYGILSTDNAAAIGVQGYGGNNTHYYLTGLDLSFLGADTKFISHLTLSCGNDNLMGKGQTAPVPEPATLILLGIGIAGLYLKKRMQS